MIRVDGDSESLEEILAAHEPQVYGHVPSAATTPGGVSTVAQLTSLARHISKLPGLAVHARLVVAASLLVAVPLRLVGFDESLWFDELFATWLRLHPVVFWDTLVSDSTQPPLFYLYMRAWISLLGDSEVSIRTPALILGLASIPLLYAISRDYLGDRWAAIPPLLLALSPAHIWYSQEARAYSALVFVTLLSFLAYLRTQRRESHPAWYAVYFVSVLAGSMTHYYMVMYTGAISALCLLERRRLGSTLCILTLNMIVLLAIIGFVMYKQQYSPIFVTLAFLRPFTVREFWALFFNWFLLGNALFNQAARGSWELMLHYPVVSAVQVLGCIAFLRGATLLSRGDWRSRLLFTYLLLVPTALFTLTLLGARNIFVERSALVSLPFFLIVLARGVVGFGRAAWTTTAVGALLAVVVISLGAFFAKGDEWTVYKQNPDFRAATHYLRRERDQSGSSQFMIAFSSPLAVYHYDDRIVSTQFNGPLPGRPPVPPDVPRLVLDAPGLRPDLCSYAAATAGSDSFYVMNDRTWTPAFDRVLEAIERDGRCRIVEVLRFKLLDLHRVSASQR